MNEPVSVMKEKYPMHETLKSKVYDRDNQRPLKDHLTMHRMLLYYLESSYTSPTLAIDNTEYHDLF